MRTPYKRRALAEFVAAIAVAGFVTACGGNDGGDNTSAVTPTPTPDPVGPGVYDGQLAFDKSKYTTITVTLDGVATPVRWYREVCYVGKPMKLAPRQPALGPPINVDNQTCGYQNLNVFVREVDAA